MCIRDSPLTKNIVCGLESLGNRTATDNLDQIIIGNNNKRIYILLPVSYTHLDVYKRQIGAMDLEATNLVVIGILPLGS